MRRILNINRKWAFSKQATTVPREMPSDWCFVNLPHSWNAIDGQDGDNDYFRGTCYYVKKLTKAELPKADKYYLESLDSTARHTLKDEEFNKTVQEYVKGLKPEVSDYAINQFEVKEIKEPEYE